MSSNRSENFRNTADENSSSLLTVVDDREDTTTNNNSSILIGSSRSNENTIHQQPPIINVLNPRKRFLSLNTPANRNLVAAGKRFKNMDVDDDIAREKNILSEQDGMKRPNFSAISNSNVSITKTPTNTSKPGDIRKLVIKNFKGMCS